MVGMVTGLQRQEYKVVALMGLVQETMKLLDKESLHHFALK